MRTKQLPWFGLVFLLGLVAGKFVLPASDQWELQLVRKDSPRASTKEQPAGGQIDFESPSKTAAAKADETAGSREPVAASTPVIDALHTAATSSLAGQRGTGAFEDADQPPEFAPPPHLTETDFNSLFEVQDRIDERVENLAGMIADMERDGLPEEHIAFLKEALLAEESLDDGSFDTLFDGPAATDDARAANIVESYGEAGASPEEVEEMLEVMREGFESAEDPAADWDLHNPPVPLD